MHLVQRMNFLPHCNKNFAPCVSHRAHCSLLQRSKNVCDLLMISHFCLPFPQCKWNQTVDLFANTQDRLASYQKQTTIHVDFPLLLLLLSATYRIFVTLTLSIRCWYYCRFAVIVSHFGKIHKHPLEQLIYLLYVSNIFVYFLGSFFIFVGFFASFS